ncbi:MAG: cysteine--tRNA ligase [Methyloceanibacter sp.]
MALRLYNTLTRKKEPFQPIDAGNVRMYVCGPTVYDFAHIGNARPVIVFDVLFRLLRHLYGPEHVTYVRNITDVDDKINARAAEDYPDLPLNEAIRRVTEKTEKQFHEDVAALGCLPPTVEPRATEHIAAMREMIDGLVANGCAYVAEDHVLFDVAAMPDYGKLSGRSLDEMIAGARVEVAPYKRDPMDFVLWKPSKPGEPSWTSPAGIAAPGRPGWHIECSAMSWKHLGETFDIHGGGIDLVFPHHENEIAQSRCAFHTPVMANYWLHNGFLQVEGEKMAKSIGNFVTIHELLRGWAGSAWSGAAIRAAMLKTHYRQPLNWTVEALEFSRAQHETWALTASQLSHSKSFHYRSVEPEPDSELLGALSDDLNTPAALTIISEQHASASKGDLKAATHLLGNLQFIGLLNTSKLRAYMRGVGAQGKVSQQKLFENMQLGEALKVAVLNGDTEFEKQLRAELRTRNLRAAIRQGGVMLSAIDESMKADEDRVDVLIAARHAARKAKDFKEADRIRDELAAMGIELKDAKDPKTGELVTTWEVAR